MATDQTLLIQVERDFLSSNNDLDVQTSPFNGDLESQEGHAEHNSYVDPGIPQFNDTIRNQVEEKHAEVHSRSTLHDNSSKRRYEDPATPFKGSPLKRSPLKTSSYEQDENGALNVLRRPTYTDPETPFRSLVNSDTSSQSEPTNLQEQPCSQEITLVKSPTGEKSSVESLTQKEEFNRECENIPDLMVYFDSLKIKDHDIRTFSNALKSFSFNMLEQLVSWKENTNRTHGSIVEELITEHERKHEKLQTNLDETTSDCQHLVHDSSQQRKIKEKLAEHHSKMIHKLKNRSKLCQIFTKWRAETLITKIRLQDLKNRSQRRKIRQGFFNWYRRVAKMKEKKLNQMWEKRLKNITDAISKEYETQLMEMRSELVDQRNEISQLQRQEKRIIGQMKSAVVRGVSRLNEETMSLFSRDL